MQRRSPRTPETAPLLVREGELRAGPLVALWDLLPELGVDRMAVFASAGIDPALIEDPDNPVPFTAAGRALMIAAEKSGCRHIGLLVGRRCGIEVLGPVGLMARNAPSVGVALGDIILNLHLHDAGAVPSLEVDGRVATLSYAIYDRAVEGAEHIYDCAIVIACNILRGLCGHDWRPDEVLLSRSRPRASAPYGKVFDAPVRFDADMSSVVFRARFLAMRPEGADPAVYAALGKQIAALEAVAEHDLPHRLRRALRFMLVTGRGSRQEVAKMFSMHGRTLNRRLQARGTSFHALVDEVRFEIARQLLGDTRMSLGQIAATLDYADASAFTRAFRRWSGAAPSAWRAGREHAR